MATLYKANGYEREIAPANKKAFTLAELQGYVGGYIEVLTPAGGINDRLVVNEEGLLLGLAPNVAASCLAGQPIVGPAVLCVAKGEELV